MPMIKKGMMSIREFVRLPIREHSPKVVVMARTGTTAQLTATMIWKFKTQ